MENRLNENLRIGINTSKKSTLALVFLAALKGIVGFYSGSTALIADAMHSYTDVFSSLVVVIAIAGSMSGMPWLDSIGVLVISLMIFRLGIGIARDSALVLMDAWLDKESIVKIRQAVCDIQGVNNVEDIRLRKSGLVVFGEIIVETKGDVDLKKVEMLSDEIKSAVKKEVNNLEHIIVNAKPGKMAIVKVAVPVVAQDGLRSKLSLHLGKAPFFIIIEMENDGIKCWDVIKNPAAALEKKKGVKTAEFLISRDVNVLIIRDIGEGPFHVLRDNFVKILQMPETAKNVEDVVEKVPELNTIISPTENRT
ncbi:MAG: cation diffusion facilitator family transporter [Methanosarcinales archaeon]|nr:cation diffusion facilitator family transporter [Methanosarcinales archaeon]